MSGAKDLRGAPEPVPPSALERPAGVRGRVLDRLEAGGRYPRWVLASTLAGMFATTFPGTMLTVSLADVARDLGTTEATMTWVLSLPLLCAAVALPILGKVGDLYGHRRVFLLGFALAATAAAGNALAQDAATLIGLRTLAQVIGSATIPTSMALIMSVHAREDRVKAMGWWSFVSAGAPAIGLAAGGPLVEALGWRLLFVVQAGLAAGALAVAWFVLREVPRRTDLGFDIPGAVALAGAVGGAMLVLDQSPERGWADPLVVGAAAVFPVALLAFLRIERRARFPLLDLDLFRDRNFSAPILATFFASTAYMGGYVLAPLLLRGVFGLSLSTTALLMILRPLSFSLSSPIGGRLAVGVGERTSAVAGTAMVGGALGLFALGAAVEVLVLAAAALVLQGVGNGVFRPSLTASMANAVPEADLGIAAATQRMFQEIGAALGITLLVSVQGGTDAGFPRAYVIGAGFALVATAIATRVRSSERALPAVVVPAGTPAVAPAHR